ncbi:MAG: hypothetical protein FJ384_04700 [Verrucomicrobia bacterium]|nr:hypothetical protein [Verrucomicrobiota bacterium]
MNLSLISALMLCAALASAQIPCNPFTAPGAYDTQAWRAEWPGCPWEDGVSEGRVSVVARPDGKRWRIDYAPGRIGPSEGGAAWNQSFESRDEVVLSYVVRFSPDFDWKKGGKLPGLGGGPGKTTGGRKADGLNGFSVRPMWRADGRMEAYAYHAGQTKDYGDSFSLPKTFLLPRDQDVNIRLRVRLNHPERADGLLELKVTFGDTSAEVAARTMVWRKTPTIQADKVLFETFHGGNDLSWAPDRPCHAEFGGLRLE